MTGIDLESTRRTVARLPLATALAIAWCEHRVLSVKPQTTQGSSTRGFPRVVVIGVRSIGMGAAKVPLGVSTPVVWADLVVRPRDS